MNLNPLLFTNATKGLIIAFVNSILVALPAFDVLTSDDQMTAVVGIFNAAAAVFLGMTYKASPTRVTDA
jgi:hypothetical protein